MDVMYRDFEERDFGDFREMVLCLYDEDPEGQAISDEKIARTVRESLASPEKLRIVMICADGKIIGYGLLVFYWSNEYGGDILNIDELYIGKEYRNSGIASGFIERLKREYENVAAIAVEATPSNEAAERLYARLGFEASPNAHLIRQV